MIRKVRPAKLPDLVCLEQQAAKLENLALHGLHHLDDPYRAIGEIVRVAREGVLILEPAQAALTQLAVRLGLAEEVEEAGNYVRWLVPQDVERRLRQLGFGRVAWKRTLRKHEPIAKGRENRKNELWL